VVTSKEAGSAVALGIVLGALGCGTPFLAQDGTVAFPEKGAHGASVVTASGVEFHDRKDVPERIVVRDPSEPWRPPIGFILPQNRRFTVTSQATVVITPGLSISLRPSDTRVPSWGGEVLVRIDLQAPAQEGTTRPPERIAVVIDGEGGDTAALAEVVLAQLSAQDRVTMIDAAGARVVVPMLPASHRSLALGAMSRRLAGPRGAHTLGAALTRAGDAVGSEGVRRIVVLSDGAEGRAYAPDVSAALSALASRGVSVSAFGTTARTDGGGLSAIVAFGGGTFEVDPSIDARAAAIRREVPPAGLVVLRDVVLTFEGTPAPSHVLEASGGDVHWRLDAGELALGDVRAGEARTEVVRVTVPAWVPGERFEFTVTAHAEDVTLGTPREFAARLPCAYDDDIERIAESRHGDVIAYASALATLSRLDAAFLGGGAGQSAKLRETARLHARSMATLARDLRDRAMQEQAEVLDTLLEATSTDAP
jgi:hypothetical protein